MDLNLKNLDLYARFSEKKFTTIWKMWTFTRAFLKSVDLSLKNIDIYAWFSGGPRSQKCRLLRVIFGIIVPRPEKCAPLCLIFWKNVDLDLKNMDLYAWFSEKVWTSTCKMWTSTCKMWTFKNDFLKNDKLNPKILTLMCDFLKILDLYMRFSEKRIPQLKKMWTLKSDFLKNLKKTWR